MAMVTADLNEDRFPDRVVVVAPARCRDLIASIPGSGYRRVSASEGLWTIPFTWAACKQLRATFGDELELSDSLTSELWKMHHHEVACESRRLLAQNIAPPDAPPVLDPDRPELLEYQALAVDWLMLRGSGGVLDDMGVGKTATGCAAARYWVEAYEIEDGQPHRALIVCPKTKRLDWLEELELWWPEGNHTALSGTPAKRRKAIAAWLTEGRSGALVASWEDIKAHSRLASYGNVKLPEAKKTPKEFNAIAWTAVVADEAHRGLNPKSDQTRALWWLGDHARHRLALTGTPISNDSADIWPILRFVAPEEWSGRSKFLDRYVRLSYSFWGGAQVEGLQDETRDEFHELSGRWWIRRTKEQVLPWLPKKRVTRRWVELPPKLRKAYNQFAKELVLDVAGGQVMAFSGLTQAARLAQLACAAVEINEDGDVRMVEPSPKVDALLEVWEDFGKQPMAVLSASRQLLDLAAARLDKLEIPHVAVVGGMPTTAVQEAKAMYNSGEVDIILISLGAGAEGLSLSRGSLEVILNRSLSSPKNTQGDDRMHGLGRGDHGAEHLDIVEILTENTVDQGRLELLEKKGLQAEEVLRDKEKLKELLSYGL